MNFRKRVISMKQKLINVGYFLPAVISLILYLMLAVNSGFGSLNPLVWCFVALLFVSAALMMQKKWWGCIGGCIAGAVLVYMGTQYTGQIISETPIGIVLCIYYVIFGLLCFRNKRLYQ